MKWQNTLFPPDHAHSVKWNLVCSDCKYGDDIIDAQLFPDVAKGRIILMRSWECNHDSNMMPYDVDLTYRP